MESTSTPNITGALADEDAAVAETFQLVPEPISSDHEDGDDNSDTASNVCPETITSSINSADISQTAVLQLQQMLTMQNQAPTSLGVVGTNAGNTRDANVGDGESNSSDENSEQNVGDEERHWSWAARDGNWFEYHDHGELGAASDVGLGDDSTGEMDGA